MTPVDVQTAKIHLMSRQGEDGTSPKPVGLSRTRLSAFSDAISFALVGVAAVGFVVETLDLFTDSAQGVLEVGCGAVAGGLASVVYGRLETRADRAARARVLAWDVVRFFVAFELMRYGAAKLVGMQFYPRYYQLDTRPADLTPMALAWTFFGRVYGYQAASGVLEIAAAVLLCFRRTAVLGACVLLPIMANIVLLDFFYDIPIKLFSSIYLVMALYVLAPEARRFWTFFLGDGPVPPRSARPGTTTGTPRPMATAFAIALVLVLPSADIIHKAAQRGLFHSDPLEGAWTIEQRVGLDDLLSVEGTWDKLYMEKGDYGFLRLGEQRLRLRTDVDERARTLRLFEIGSATTWRGAGERELVGTFVLDGKHLHIDGTHEGKAFSMDLIRDLPK